MINQLKLIIKSYFIILVLFVNMSCEFKSQRFLKVSNLNENKIFTLNINERKAIDITLPDEREIEFLKIQSKDPSIVEVESSRSMVLKGVRNGKTKIGVFYQEQELYFEVEVYDTRIQPK